MIGSEPAPLPAIRRLLAAALLAGTLGMLVELLLIGHFESAWQFVPLVLLTAGLVVAGWQLRTQTGGSTRLLQVMMMLFVVSGVIGVGLHYSGNAEFEREMYPSLSGLALMGGSLTGATPVLAPGSMALLGVIGLTYAHGHPALAGAPESPAPQEELP